MRKMLCAFSALFVALSILFVPVTAFAGTIPTTDEIRFSGTPLSTATPSGVSYNSSTGTLTLNNYNGGPIEVDVTSRPYSDWHVVLNINLIGTNSITAKGGTNTPASPSKAQITPRDGQTACIFQAPAVVPSPSTAHSSNSTTTTSTSMASMPVATCKSQATQALRST